EAAEAVGWRGTASASPIQALQAVARGHAGAAQTLKRHMRSIRIALVLAAGVAALGCGGAEPADVLLVGGRVYTFTWPEPDRDGRPASSAPHDSQGWRPD